jgi:tRNA-specific 2-thiouridylase
VGSHDGIEHFTIGQRKGLGVAWSEPLHVVKLDGAMNQVVVAPRREAGRIACQVAAINWVSIAPPQAALQVEVQVRYRSAPELALLTPISDSTCQLQFLEEQFSITPGQAAVFYAGELLLGGGLIQRETAIQWETD